jgi:four helix bundle protein
MKILFVKIYWREKKMGKIMTYRDLEVWKESMNLTEMIYRITKNYPQAELYGLTSQIQRAAVSIPANIAEGHDRMHKKEYQYHLSVARGSLAEVETQLILSHRLNYITKEQTTEIWEKAKLVGKLLNGLLRALKN